MERSSSFLVACWEPVLITIFRFFIPDALSLSLSLSFLIPQNSPISNNNSRGGTSIRNYNSYSAPPLIGGYGYGMPYGYGGGGLLLGGPSVVVGGGGFFNLIFFMFVASAVLSAFRNASKGGGGGSSRDDEDDDF